MASLFRSNALDVLTAHPSDDFVKKGRNGESAGRSFAQARFQDYRSTENSLSKRCKNLTGYYWFLSEFSTCFAIGLKLFIRFNFLSMYEKDKPFFLLILRN